MIEQLCCGMVPIYEPHLDELLKRNPHMGRISFSTELEARHRRCARVPEPYAHPNAARAGGNGASLDPHAGENAEPLLPGVAWCGSPLEAAEKADVTVYRHGMERVPCARPRPVESLDAGRRAGRSPHLPVGTSEGCGFSPYRYWARKPPARLAARSRRPI